jgi:hypothetical protein
VSVAYRSPVPKRLLVAALALAGALAGGSPAAIPGIPALYVYYDQTCVFTLTADPGTLITATAPPGPTLPPGQYQLLTQMPNPSNGYLCTSPSFSLTGPGVSISIPFPGQALDDNRLLTLQPSGTYTAEDESAPAATRHVFSTSATGSSTSLLPTTTTSSGPGGSQQQPDIVGSARAPFRGVLVARVGASGAVTLTRAGRRVAALRAGRYTIEVDDVARHAGFFVARSGRRPLAVSGVPFVGRRRLTVTFTPGRWAYFATSGNATPFVVSSA